jgi:hypothetical protein
VVYVDGILRPGVLRPNDFPIDWIEAIEVYTDAGTRPVEFNATTSHSCLVLIWLRR